MPIYVPSLSRYDRRECTLDWIPSCWRKHTYLVVQNHQYDMYRIMAQRYQVNIMVLPSWAKKIGSTRREVAHHAHEIGCPWFIMMDDDLTFFTRRDQRSQDEDKWWRMTPATEEEMMEIILQLSQDLQVYEHLGISAREGNNWIRPAYAHNVRYMRVTGFQTESYLDCELDRIDGLEDFDVALQMLAKGKQSLVYYKWAQGQGQANEEGGCADWRTSQSNDVQVELLHSFHPRFVSVRQKVNKTDRDGFGTRKEVTIRWKEAAKEGYYAREEREKRE